jgi:hypothetical protein
MLYWYLCGYFLAFSVNLVALIVTLWLYGWGSAYAWVYALSSVPIFLTIAVICREVLRTRQYSFRVSVLALILAATIGHLTYVGIAHPANAYEWIHLIEGTLLVWAGAILGGCARRTEIPQVSLLLGILWLVQSAFSLGYVLHWDWPSWMGYNWYVPQAIPAVGFSLIGFLVRHQRLATLPQARLP